jgi:hypothetical protein
MCLLLRDTAEMACRVAQRITYVTNDTNGNPDFRNNFTKHEIMYNYKCSDQNNMIIQTISDISSPKVAKIRRSVNNNAVIRSQNSSIYQNMTDKVQIIHLYTFCMRWSSTAQVLLLCRYLFDMFRDRPNVTQWRHSHAVFSKMCAFHLFRNT